MTNTREQGPASNALDVPEDKQPLSIWIEVSQRSENFCVARDTRHGKEGFRVLRYVSREGEMVWDSRYQFYETLDQLYVAIESEDYTKGQRYF